MSTTSIQTLSAMLLAKADSRAGVTFIEGQDTRSHISYASLLDTALQRLAQFQSLGLKPGSQLIIQTNDNRQFLEGFWACLLGGITAVPVSGGNTSEHRFKLFRIAAKLSNPGLFTDTQTRSRLAEFSRSHALVDAYAALDDLAIDCEKPAPSGANSQAYAAKPDDVAFIQFSSGSTSTPKGVVLTHKNLMTNCRAIVKAAQMDEHEHMLSWMPLTHDMGLIGFHLTPVLLDASHSLMPTDVFVRRPGLWLTEASHSGATILCSPNFGYQHLLKSFKPQKHEGLDLSRVRLLYNGAEPISVSLCQRFMAAMAPFKLAANAMFPVYGLAEASLAVSFPSVDHSFATMRIHRGRLGVGQAIEQINDASDTSAVTLVSVGKPIDHVELQISDDDGNALPELMTGHIRIRGDNVTQGYYQEPELNAATISADGWLDTGDLGFIHEQQLYITGRAKDIIFVSGQNVYPHDLEEIVLQAGLAERGKLAIASQRADDAEEERLLVFVLHRAEASALNDTARQITRVLGEAAGVRIHAVVPVSRIPKTTSGKVQRYLLAASLENGDYPVLIQSTTSTDQTSTTDDMPDTDAPTMDTRSRLLQICNEQVEQLSVGADDNLFELGISSLTLAQIHAAIDQNWPDQVDVTDLFDYPTVSELTAFLDAQTAA